LIGVRSFGDGGVGVNGKPDENSGTDNCSPDEEIPCDFISHKNLLFFLRREIYKILL
jgi:hypothetical protein